MPDLRIRRRSRLRRKEVEALSGALTHAFSSIAISGDLAVDYGDYDKTDVYISQGRIIAFKQGDRAFPSLRLIVSNPPASHFLTVDMGAVRFVCNGADVMGPGVVGADADLKPGDAVWIRDEKNLKPLAVAIALVPASEMVRGRGKVAQNLHFVGDRLWSYEG